MYIKFSIIHLFIEEYPDYETAIKYAKKAEDTTNIDSDDETQTGRQRKRPKRFDSPVLYSSSGEEAEVEEGNALLRFSFKSTIFVIFFGVMFCL